MKMQEAIIKRIWELVDKNSNPTTLSLNSNMTPSTLFNILHGETKCPSVFTIKKLCAGAGITLSEFFNRPYFNDTDEVYE